MCTRRRIRRLGIVRFGDVAPELALEVRDVVVTTLKVCRPRPGRRGGRPRPGQLSRYSLLQLWHRFCTKVAPMAMGERGFGFAGHCQWLCVSAIHADLLRVARVAHDA